MVLENQPRRSEDKFKHRVRKAGKKKILARDLCVLLMRMGLPHAEITNRDLYVSRSHVVYQRHSPEGPLHWYAVSWDNEQKESACISCGSVGKTEEMLWSAVTDTENTEIAVTPVLDQIIQRYCKHMELYDNLFYHYNRMQSAVRKLHLDEVRRKASYEET